MSDVLWCNGAVSCAYLAGFGEDLFARLEYDSVTVGLLIHVNAKQFCLKCTMLTQYD